MKKAKWYLERMIAANEKPIEVKHDFVHPNSAFSKL
jgi:hypothetical protein